MQYRGFKSLPIHYESISILPSNQRDPNSIGVVYLWLFFFLLRRVRLFRRTHFLFCVDNSNKWCYNRILMHTNDGSFSDLFESKLCCFIIRKHPKKKKPNVVLFYS